MSVIVKDTYACLITNGRYSIEARPEICDVYSIIWKYVVCDFDTVLIEFEEYHKAVKFFEPLDKQEITAYDKEMIGME